MNPEYTRKTIFNWMNEIHSGHLALADFQRSRVWEDTLVVKFLKAVLTGQTTGTLLMVEPSEDLIGRNVDGGPSDISMATNLILDGQQRLTSLYHGLMDAGARRYYIKVKNLAESDFEICDVIARASTFRDYVTVNGQFSDNVIPVRLLYDPPNHPSTEPTRLEAWCEEAIENSQESNNLRRAIERKFKRPMEQYVIWYAQFTGINLDEAVKIFIETNRSSVKIKAFDLAVAWAVEVRNDLKFRARIEAFHASNGRVQHYFNRDSKDEFIPEIGEFILKIACLKVGRDGLAPKQGNFERAVKEFLFVDGSNNADSVERFLNTTLGFLETHGVATKDFVPRVPPIYVIAALQDKLENIHERRRSQALNLLTSYLWWSFLSDRYNIHANDHLHQDYIGLKNDLERISNGDEAQKEAEIFSTAKLIVRGDLLNERNVIKSRSPIGRAITAITLDATPRDWVTGEDFTPNVVRELEIEEELDRHHVFPRRALTHGDGSLRRGHPMINNCLNIVLLRKKANITLRGKEPSAYLAKLQEDDSQLTDEELENRIRSQATPYDELWTAEGSVSNRYREFLERRADLLWGLISARTQV